MDIFLESENEGARHSLLIPGVVPGKLVGPEQLLLFDLCSRSLKDTRPLTSEEWRHAHHNRVCVMLNH